MLCSWRHCSCWSCLDLLVPDDITNIGWPSSTVNAGRKKSRLNKIKVVRRECEVSVQIVNLPQSQSGVTSRGTNFGFFWSMCKAHGIVLSPMNECRALISFFATVGQFCTYLKPQVVWHIVRTHVRGNIYANDLFTQRPSEKSRESNQKRYLLHNRDIVLQPLRPMMPSHAHSLRLFAVVELAGRLDGHRRHAERLAVAHQGEWLLPNH